MLSAPYHARDYLDECRLDANQWGITRLIRAAAAECFADQ